MKLRAFWLVLPLFAFTNAGVRAKSIPDLSRAEQLLRAALDKNPVYASALLQLADVALANSDLSRRILFHELQRAMRQAIEQTRPETPPEVEQSQSD